MHFAKLITIAAAVALMAPACSGPEPAPEPAREESAAERAAAELDRKRNDESAQLEKRVADVERRWTEMQTKVAEKKVAPTSGLRSEVQEDIKNVREAVADLKTTNLENWWDRHERAMERTADDIEEDVRRFAKSKQPAAAPRSDTAATPGPFESRRDQFVTRLRARVDVMEEQLKNVRARNAQETELEDTRARINKLKEDVDRLRKASADDWWDISSKRVSEYIDRLERSVGRLDNDKR
jgi:DNA repair exonuclease SbcCD ATPase subunit